MILLSPLNQLTIFYSYHPYYNIATIILSSALLLAPALALFAQSLNNHIARNTSAEEFHSMFAKYYKMALASMQKSFYTLHYLI
ncbi:hypothetical protein BDB00DRAFT_817614 [Zychaea mexicana]|uniref:uncharacterized protein n=1 Tax=Zychaea mexicana TaxID=64656 RepID=UPI0022FEC460|nr:uncharacterized protein BDB00DRAFT_817614 [Zychaea mexicana]KAI9494635.1 hypothetical protein BDB00DRAFT_817614 [Zychaea mexicana]